MKPPFASFGMAWLAAVSRQLWMASATATHPLDGLTATEYTSLLEILTAAGHVSETTRFPIIHLHEPHKDAVQSWTAGEVIPRVAEAILKEGPKSYKTKVDLVAKSVLSFEPAEGEGMILFEEFMGATELALSSPEIVAGLAARGIKPEEVYCAPLTAGSFNDPMEVGKRLLKVPCVKLPTGNNYFSMPVEGLFALIDLNAMEVLEVVDTGIVPVNTDEWDYSEAGLEKRFGTLRGSNGKIETASETKAEPASGKSNPNIKFDGSFVEWDIWRFHWRVDKRPGVILSQIQVKDLEKWRSVAYQMHLSEVFVPYMDPSEAWYFRTYMDSGEYGFGLFMSPLRPGLDCPRTATFLPMTLSDDMGMPFEVPDVICIFERSNGDPAWRHFEAFVQGPDTFVPAEGRPHTELVVRSAAQVGNYDYLVQYVFEQDGTIRVEVGSTGLDAVKGAASMSMNDATAEEETRFGTLIAPQLVAANHDHYFNFRMDLDVDGTSNGYKKGKLVPMDMSPFTNIPRKSMWTVEYMTMATELAARTQINPQTPCNFYFINENVESGLGHHPSYQLLPGGSFTYHLMDLADMPIYRNAYIDNHIHVTPYTPSEMYAGGEYTVQSTGNDTLYIWTAQDRPIDNTDIVTWYTMGFHHVPRMEDWPVMPLHWASFSLRPTNFFSYNPAIQLAMPAMENEEQKGTPDATTTSGHEKQSNPYIMLWIGVVAILFV